MKISVVTPTARGPLYLRPFYEGLIRQLPTFPRDDFEWVVVHDGWSYVEAELFQKLIAGVNLVLVEQRDPESPYHSFAIAANDGFLASSGELVHISGDYMEFTGRKVLANQWRIFEKYGPMVFLSGPGPVSREVGDVVIEPGVGEITDPALMRRSWLGGRNDAVGMEAFLLINGFDERLAGHHGDTDHEIGTRLMNLGCRYLLDLDPEGLATMQPHQKAKPERDRVEWMRTWWVDVWPDIESGKTTWTPNGYDLREERARRLARNEAPR